MAFWVIAVSSRVSPLRTEEVATSMLMTSAAEPFGRDLEARPRARRVFEEQVDDGAAGEPVAPFVDGPVLVDVGFR